MTSSIDLPAVQRHHEGLPGLTALQDFHLWSISTTKVCLTAHLVMTEAQPGDTFLMKAAHGMEKRFRIGHTTLRVETGADTVCALAPDYVA